MAGVGKRAKGGMRTALALVFALGCAATAHAADAPAVTSAPVVAAAAPSAGTNTAITIMKADAAIHGGDCAKALPLLAQLWDDPVLQTQDAALAEKYRYSRVVCTLQTEDAKAALAMSTQSVAHAGAGIDTYDLHAFLLLMDNRPEEAGATLDEALTRFPGDASKLTGESVIGTLMALQQNTPDATPPLLDHLEKVHWQVDNVSLRFAVDFMRLSGLRAAVKRHDHAVADLYRADLSSNAMLYIVSQGDADISDPAAPPLPIKPIIKKQINQIGTYVAAHPNALASVDYLITLEHMNEDDDVAMVQLGGIFDLLNANGLDKFEDPETLPDLFYQKATLLAEAGRVDAALATYKDAAARMSGASMFDFNLNYMNFLVDIGRDQDALGVEGRIDLLSLTAAQRRQLSATEACVYAYTGDPVRYQAALALTRDRSGIGAMQSYLCAGDLDHAAQAMIRDINDPDQRDRMIGRLQATLPDIPYSPRSKAYYAGASMLKKRPDVQAAAKVQNIIVRSWPLRF